MLINPRSFDVAASSVARFVRSIPPRHWRDFRRQFNNHKWEQTDDGGIYLGESKTLWRGDACEVLPDGSLVPWGHNLITTEGMNYLLTVGVHDGVKISTFYGAPFGVNTTPTVALTAANFASTQTELTTQYSESTRVAFVESAPSGGACDNTANPMVFTSASGTLTIWGIGLLSVSTKASTSGTLLNCFIASAAKTATAPDAVSLAFTLSVSNVA